MRKLAMDLDALNVQSFVTDEFGPLPFGTVHGRQKEQTGRGTECRDADADSRGEPCADTNVTLTRKEGSCPACPSSNGCA